ncbi:unnamed protein product [Lactuca saligna]|uniref:Uncharacterized protein n=1 Tax=Lactuca saligna TaxID=75948 RepID=A0AA35ZL59_LACSI|nr:unnamed protein product [Lactuca saligna]
MKARYRGCCCCFLNRRFFHHPSRRQAVDYRCHIVAPSSFAVSGCYWNGRNMLVSVMSVFSMLLSDLMHYLSFLADNGGEPPWRLTMMVVIVNRMCRCEPPAEMPTLQMFTFLMSDPRNFDFLGQIPIEMLEKVQLDNSIVKEDMKLTLLVFNQCVLNIGS